MTAADFWQQRGFTRICTGGNCYAWERTLRSEGAAPVQILITSYDDQETRSVDELHVVGLYLEGEGLPFAQHDGARNALSAWEWIRFELAVPEGD